MASSDMRLRLIIRRHGLPEVKIVWPCTATDDLTVACLLSSVNEVIPLESTDWGLEDYVVELTDGQGGSFECLHFQQIHKILKHDDQVLYVAPPSLSELSGFEQSLTGMQHSITSHRRPETKAH
jgi:hypothetical protein